MPEPCNIKELNGKRYRCYFELTLKVIGGKWKPIILYHLALEGVLRFGELRRGIPDVTERMLTKQLRELEADGLIHREVFREVPPKVEYTLTHNGMSLIPLLQELRQWGVNYERQQNGLHYENVPGYEQEKPLPIAERYRSAASDCTDVKHGRLHRDDNTDQPSRCESA